MKITRRDSLAILSAASLAAVWGPSAAFAAEGEMHDQQKLLTPVPGITDHALGSETAPVTVIEYASPTCPHCATFHNTVYPELKAQYVDTGKVRFIVRPFARNILDIVVFMLADAAGPENYHTVLETFFRSQAQWAGSQTPKDAMLQVATQLGFTPESFDTALADQELYNSLEAARTQALDEFKLEGTPTFYVNGKQLTGDKTFEQLAAEIDPLIPAGFVPAAPAEAAPVTPAPAASTPMAPAGGAMAPAPMAPAGGAMAPAPMAPAAPQ